MSTGRAVEDPALADAGLRRPAGLPADEAVRPSRSQRSIVGTSPERRARRSTSSATPSSWTNTMPGTSVAGGRLARRRANAAVRRSNQASSSSAMTRRDQALITASPMTITSAVPKPSSVTPGSWSSTRPTSRASSTIAPMPRVSTEIGTTTNGEQRPHDRVDHADDEAGEEGVAALSMSKPSSTAASSHSASAVVMTTTIARRRTWPAVGRCSAARGRRVGCVSWRQLRSLGRAWAGSNVVRRSAARAGGRRAGRGRQLVGEAVHGCVEPGGRRTPTGQ